MVPVTDRGEGADRSVAEALQHGAAAFESRLSHAGRFRGEAREARRNGRPSDGADRCGIWGLRAPPRRTTVPPGANARSNLGCRLNLNVFRRTRAGQTSFPNYGAATERIYHKPLDNFVGCEIVQIAP